ncbi:UDP-N-acetylmuramate--L-alanine ligase [Desulfuribacillus alkaliarsenatis]|uniref:UDP-N-acetylmuramate--L-alanine ligase n=1 Tax=Desulfuribacillus alkaliarsenatis TaxID=766136 RepID=A0A1E5G574_9FIRM|nr:UDP-N-acetylmuramate--L-alanine ligase [Desulfuribacillus alkaliarsenatis]OEF98318.1 UDP-N-acetylmuramate--L-alanine ligase [Desulfuribacillus alkaliarsenatis]
MNNSQKLHFVGIGGYGMSAIARVMLDWGYEVTGSDVVKKDLTERLQEKGAQVYIGHDAENVSGADLVIYSTDIPKDNVELMAALEKKIPLIHRSEMLARILNRKDGITVAGAHGKTTTSSMIAYIMEKSGQDPTFVIGGEVMGLGSNAKAGLSEYVIAEADESDGSFLNYFSKIAVITNIEPDHLENYDGKFENLKAAYRKYLQQIKHDGCAIISYEDKCLREMTKDLACEIITFGLSTDADYYVDNLKQVGRHISFDVYRKQDFIGSVQLKVPGKHNVLNALSAIIACMEAGVSFETAKQKIESFQGAKRRFTIMGEANDITIVDDYAHHPTEIQATLAAAKASGKHVVAIFQPQRYTRTFFLFDDFSRAFADADEVYVLDIYSPAGEKKIDGVSAEKLVEMIRKNSHHRAEFVQTKEEIIERMKRQMKPGDIVLTMGAGDIWKASVDLAKYVTNNM